MLIIWRLFTSYPHLEVIHWVTNVFIVVSRHSESPIFCPNSYSLREYFSLHIVTATLRTGDFLSQIGECSALRYSFSAIRDEIIVFFTPRLGL